MPPLLQFCTWLYATPFGTTIRESNYAFPLIETVHTLGIMVLVGTIAVLDLRLLGLVLRDTPVSRLYRQVIPWTWGGFVVMFISGLLLFASEARDNYFNSFFRIKLLLLILVAINPLIFHATTYRTVSSWDVSNVTPRRARLAAISSLCLWGGIIVTGRLIAYAQN
jgi:hypothetical protein